MEEELYTRISGEVAFPVAWGTLGEGVSTPRAVMFRASVTSQELLEGAGLRTARVNIDCYGESYSEAITASRQITTALDRYEGTVIRGVFFETARDFADDDTGLLHRIGLTFLVTYVGA